MKKLISIFISLIMLTSIFTCFAVSATTENYHPLETGSYGHIDIKKYPVEFSGKTPEKLPLDELTESQIKDDYFKANPSADYDLLSVEYYGTLSDGSILVFVNSGDYFTALEYIVIGKYLYVTSCLGNDVRLYKNHTFTRIVDDYKNGILSDELLDEAAEILCFAKFVNVEPEPETNPSDVNTEPSVQPGTTTPDDTGIYVKGDADGDGKLSVKDATCVQRYLAGLISEQEINYSSAKVCGTDEVTVVDATMIQKVIACILTDW